MTSTISPLTVPLNLRMSSAGAASTFFNSSDSDSFTTDNDDVSEEDESDTELAVLRWQCVICEYHNVSSLDVPGPVLCSSCKREHRVM